MRKQLSAYRGPEGPVTAALKRMEEQHLQAAQRWEYKRECLKQERGQLLEMTMQAFCKVVYVGVGTQRVPSHSSLLSNSPPAASEVQQPSIAAEPLLAGLEGATMR